MEILLRDHIAAACERLILRADQRRVDHRLPTGIFCSVDEAQEITIVEVAKAMHLVDRGDGVPELGHDLRRHLEAQVHPLGADMEQEVARRRDCMPRSGLELPERVKLRGTRLAEQSVPGVGTDAQNTGESGFEIAK